MNKAHRDRIAFMRICSGKFDAGWKVYHVQAIKRCDFPSHSRMMAQDRHNRRRGVCRRYYWRFRPGYFLHRRYRGAHRVKKFAYEGIRPLHRNTLQEFRLLDSMKRKQFVKGVNQIAQEGAIQIFQEYMGGMEEIIVGVVGVLQFDVLKYRLENEYNVDIRLENLPYEHIRWIANKEEVDVEKLTGTSDMKKVKDMKGNPLLLFVNSWSVGMTLDRNENLKLEEFSKN